MTYVIDTTVLSALIRAEPGPEQRLLDARLIRLLRALPRALCNDEVSRSFGELRPTLSVAAFDWTTSM